MPVAVEYMTKAGFDWTRHAKYGFAKQIRLLYSIMQGLFRETPDPLMNFTVLSMQRNARWCNKKCEHLSGIESKYAMIGVNQTVNSIS